MKNTIIFSLLLFAFSIGHSQNTSISVHQDDMDYSYSASFPKEFTSEIKELITEEFGNPKIHNSYKIWGKNELTVKLKSGKLKMNSYMKEDSKLYKLAKQIEKEVLIVLEVPEPPKPPTPPSSAIPPTPPSNAIPPTPRSPQSPPTPPSPPICDK